MFWGGANKNSGISESWSLVSFGLLFMVFGLVFGYCSNTYAQGVSAFNLEQKREKKNKVLLTGVLARQSNLVSDAENAEDSSSFTLSPRYKFDKTHLIGANLSVAQNHVQDSGFLLGNTRISYRNLQRFEVNAEKVKFLQVLAVTAPTSEQARETQGFQGSLLYEPRFVFDLAVGNLRVPFSYRLRLQKNFRKARGNLDIDEFSSYLLEHRFQLEKNLLSTDFSLGASLRLRNSWDFAGRPGMRHRSFQFVGYQFSSQYVFQVGHTYGDTIYHTGEKIVRIDKYDRNRSSFYSNLILIF